MQRTSSFQILFRVLLVGFLAAMVLSWMSAAHAAPGCPYIRPKSPPDCPGKRCSQCTCHQNATSLTTRRVKLQIVGTAKSTMKKACDLAFKVGKTYSRGRGHVKGCSIFRIKRMREGQFVICQIRTNCSVAMFKRCVNMVVKSAGNVSKQAQKTLSGAAKAQNQKSSCYQARMKVVNACHRLKGRLVRRSCRGSSITRMTCEAYNARTKLCLHVGFCRYAETRPQRQIKKYCWCELPARSAQDRALLRKYPEVK